MSKGSVQRPDDGKYQDGWDRIFKKPRPIPDYGDLFTLKEFIDQCLYGCFTDDDGSGYYSDGEIYFAGEPANPSDLVAGHIRKDRSHVMWFNK